MDVVIFNGCYARFRWERLVGGSVPHFCWFVSWEYTVSHSWLATSCVQGKLKSLADSIEKVNVGGSFPRFRSRHPLTTTGQDARIWNIANAVGTTAFGKDLWHGTDAGFDIFHRICIQYNWRRKLRGCGSKSRVCIPKVTFACEASPFSSSSRQNLSDEVQKLISIYSWLTASELGYDH